LTSFILAATLRALADINNEHERSYDITNSQLITGSVPLSSSPSFQSPYTINTQYFQYMKNSTSSSISSEADSTNFGTYSYNITRQFILFPKSIKTFPFLSTEISFNYKLETSIYSLSPSTYSGLFERTFIIQPSEFLPAGIMTFYLSTTGTTLGQSRVKDIPKQSKQKITLENDPDVEYNMIVTSTTIQQLPSYRDDVNINLIISNRKDEQIVSVTLNINSWHYNTTLILKNQSSSNIIINQDRINPAMIIIQAKIKPNEDETCMFTLQQWR
jgi:hypothetical protein